MELKGLNVSHTKFGCGKIIKAKGALFSVKFQSGETKSFIYPDSFLIGALKFQNEEFNQQALYAYNKI